MRLQHVMSGAAVARNRTADNELKGSIFCRQQPLAKPKQRCAIATVRQAGGTVQDGRLGTARDRS